MTAKDPITWLLQDDHQPVRYRTLTEILALPATDPRVVDARAQLMDYPVTSAILSHTDDFLKSDKPYEKYTGRFWQLVFLGHFRADRSDARVGRIAEAVMAELRRIREGFRGLSPSEKAAEALRKMGD